MLRNPVTAIDSPLVRAVNEIGDGWMLLIIWAAGRGVNRFDGFQRELGVARNILAERLRRLVERGVLEKTPITEGARRMEYRLTQKGADLRNALDALQSWGDAWCERPADHGLRAAE